MKNRFYKVTKLLAALALASALMIAGKTTAQAASLPEDAGIRTIDERTILENVDTASDIAYQRTRSLHLNYGYVEISKLDFNKVQLLGTTQCHHECPEVYLYVLLDKMDPKTGEIENQIREFEIKDQNVYYLTRSMGIYVPSEYYYSVRGFHSCHHDGVIESTSTATNWVYIGKTTKPVE